MQQIQTQAHVRGARERDSNTYPTRNTNTKHTHARVQEEIQTSLFVQGRTEQNQTSANATHHPTHTPEKKTSGTRSRLPQPGRRSPNDSHYGQSGKRGKGALRAQRTENNARPRANKSQHKTHRGSLADETRPKPANQEYIRTHAGRRARSKSTKSKQPIKQRLRREGTQLHHTQHLVHTPTSKQQTRAFGAS